MTGQKLFQGSIALLALLALAGCRTTSEMPLTKDVWQIETDSKGLLFTHGSDKATLKRAAELTLKQGYTHFIVMDHQSNSGSVYVGSTPTTVNASYTANHNYSYGYGNLSGVTQGNVYGTVNTGTPIYAPTKTIKLTVFMFTPDDPRAETALDAQAILAGMK